MRCVGTHVSDGVECRPGGRTDSVLQSYGGGCATRRGMERAMETKRRWAGCTQRANPILSIPAIAASNPGDFGQGRRAGANCPASRFFTSSCLSSLVCSCTVSSCRSLSSAESCGPFQRPDHSKHELPDFLPELSLEPEPSCQRYT